MQTPAIQFHYLSGPFYFPERTKLKSFLLQLCKREGRRVQHINYIFCSDAYLLQLNVDYLDHDTLTDIITFQLSPESEPIMADIYISTDRIKENARTFQTSFLNELYRVVFHGALHCCGYKDKNKKDQQQMRSKEDEYLSLYSVSRGTKPKL